MYKLWELGSLEYNYSSPPELTQNYQGNMETKKAWLSSNETLFTKTLLKLQQDSSANQRCKI